MKVIIKYVLKIILAVILAWLISCVVILLTEQRIHHQSRMGIIFIK